VCVGGGGVEILLQVIDKSQATRTHTLVSPILKTVKGFFESMDPNAYELAELNYLLASRLWNFYQSTATTNILNHHYFNLIKVSQIFL
jgi:diadenosine tetraphosphate (Ap4A) HIT family hydrolase